MKKLQKAVAVGVLAALSGYAGAAPIFNFVQTAGFESDVAYAEYTGALATGGDSPTPQTYDTMSWYANTSTQSSLELETFESDLAGGMLEDTWYTVTRLFHNNNVITWPGPGPSPTGWTDQSIYGVFNLYDGDTKVMRDESETLISELDETTNSAPCPAPNPLGSTCDDVFTIDEGSLDVLDPLEITANDGSKWLASFRFFNPVNSAVIFPNIYTAEGETSSLDVQVLLSRVTETPEPATLSILGLGLVGLSLAKRRKANA